MGRLVQWSNLVLGIGFIVAAPIALVSALASGSILAAVLLAIFLLAAWAGYHA